jgi:hypothetical protein
MSCDASPVILRHGLANHRAGPDAQQTVLGIAVVPSDLGVAGHRVGVSPFARRPDQPADIFLQSGVVLAAVEHRQGRRPKAAVIGEDQIVLLEHRDDLNHKRVLLTQDLFVHRLPGVEQGVNAERVDTRHRKCRCPRCGERRSGWVALLRKNRGITQRSRAVQVRRRSPGWWIISAIPAISPSGNLRRQQADFAIAKLPLEEIHPFGDRLANLLVGHRIGKGERMQPRWGLQRTGQYRRGIGGNLPGLQFHHGGICRRL